MAKQKVLLEVKATDDGFFGRDTSELLKENRSASQTRSALNDIGLGAYEMDDRTPPTPMFIEQATDSERFEGQQRRVIKPRKGAKGDDSPTRRRPRPIPQSTSHIIAGEIDDNDLAGLRERDDIIVWPNSELGLCGPVNTLKRWIDNCCPCRNRNQQGPQPAPASTSVDCRPYTNPVTMSDIQTALGLNAIHTHPQGPVSGQGITVAILDTGVHGATYPIGGGSDLGGLIRPGEGDIDSHGSMCAADVLMVAPNVQLFDYPFMGNPFAGDAIDAFHAVLMARLFGDGPDITSNSYGYFVGPSDVTDPLHEFNTMDHPLNRKILEVVADGCVTIFAAGNCGQECADNACSAGGTGVGNSIHGPNSLPDVITVGAVNSLHKRLGYSSQGPGGFENNKPDLCGYSHYFGHFGPGRPGGSLAHPCDMGTSAAAPVVAGVAALLLEADPFLSPAALKDILIRTATSLDSGGWNKDTGHGVINAGAAFEELVSPAPVIV